jgi:Uma2 family endonuclease
MVTTPTNQVSFEEYLNDRDETNARYELVNGELILMPPASFLHSDIIDLIADLIKAIALENKLELKVKTGDVGVRTGVNSSRIPDISVIDSREWKKYRRDNSAVIEAGLLLAVEVVSPGSEQIERDYKDKVAEYQNSGVFEYWIVDPIAQKITVMVLKKSSYCKAVFTGDESISSSVFPTLNVKVSEILEA